MCVVSTEACDNDLLSVSFSVAVGVLDEEQVRGIGHPDPTVSDGDTAGDVETFHEDCGVIGAAVSVGIFEDSDSVPAGAG
jgi:hypothetical protein